MVLLAAAVGGRRGSAAARRTLLVPCIAVSVGLALLSATLLADGLPEDTHDTFAFAAGVPVVAAAAQARGGVTAMRNSAQSAAEWTASRAAGKARVTQQGSNQYQKQMDIDRMNRVAEWMAAENKGINGVVGSSDTSVGAAAEKIQKMKQASQKSGLGGMGDGGGFQLPSFSFPEFPAPAPTPASPAPQFSAPAPAPAPAPRISAPAPAASDGNPFAFLAEMFGMTTTTTTTTPPPSPLESFFQGLGLR